MKKHQQDSISIGGQFAKTVRKTTIWYFVLVPLTLSYLTIAMYLVWQVQPISRLFDLPRNQPTSLLLDLGIVMLPMLGAISAYLFRLDKNEKVTREAFIAEFAERDLVQSSTNRNLIYVVLTKGPDKNIEKMQLVWTPDGQCRNCQIYEDVDERNVRRFDSERFLDG